MIPWTERKDTYLHQGLRNRLVADLKERGIDDPNVLKAMAKVPRHLFIEVTLEHLAYDYKALPITAGQTISNPYTVAYQSQLLSLKPLDKILEVGTGSGYQTCVLAEMGMSVYTIERQKSLYDEANHSPMLKSYQHLVKRFYGDGYEGLPTYAPFDKVIVTAAASEVPMKLIQQMKTGGIMIIPIVNEEQQLMHRIVKCADGSYEDMILEEVNFVPMLRGKQ